MMMDFLHNYTFIYYIFIVVVSLLITSFAIPSILHVARFRHLYDDLGHFRKEHDHGIPRLGGVAIFVGFTITSLLFCMTDKALPINYLLTACIILFAMGIKDDLSGVNSNTKFIIQFVVCAILVLLGNIRLTGLYGVFGIYELPYIISVALSILLILLIAEKLALPFSLLRADAKVVLLMPNTVASRVAMVKIVVFILLVFIDNFLFSILLEHANIDTQLLIH